MMPGTLLPVPGIIHHVRINLVQLKQSIVFTSIGEAIVSFDFQLKQVLDYFTLFAKTELRLAFAHT